MFRSILAFELRYAFRQFSTIGMLVGFFALGILSTKANFGGQDVNINSPYVIAFYMALMTLFSLVVLTVLSANVLLRDGRSRMEEIIFSSSVTKAHYLGVRFAGIVTATTVIYTASCVGLMVGVLIGDPGRMGPFSLWHYLQPLFVFGLPNILFGASLLFACAILFRNTMAVYVGGALIYILYMVGSIAGNSPLMAHANLDGPQNDLFSVLLDPFGLVGFMSHARFWTAIEKNTLTALPDGPFLVNRLVWPAISLLLVGFVYRLFSFRTVRRSKAALRRGLDPGLPLGLARGDLAGRARARVPEHGGVNAAISAVTEYRTVPVSPDTITERLRALLKSAGVQTRIAVRSIPFVVLLLLWVFLAAITLTERLHNSSFDTVLYATTGQTVTLLLASLSQLGGLVVIFYAAELVWNERQSRMDGLLDAAPTSNIVTVASKAAAIAVVIGLFITAGIATGLCVQLASGYSRLELPIYASLYYYAGLPLLLIGIFAVAIQNVLNNKYAAVLLTVAIVLASARPHGWGLEHPMLRFAAAPTLTFSDMSGFGFVSRPFHAYMVYWSSLSVILFCFTAAAWQRGTQTGLWARVLSASPGRLPHATVRRQSDSTAPRFRSRFFARRTHGLALPTLITGLIALAAFVASGMYIYRETNVRKTYSTIAAAKERRASYERTYGSLIALPQPTITRVSTRVDLYPDQRRYELAGTYVFANKDTLDRDIATLVITLHDEVDAVDLSVPRSDSISADPAQGIYIAHLSPPLPRDSTGTLSFTLRVDRSGFSSFNSENSILRNGTYIELEDFIPHFGYDPERELEAPIDRADDSLPPHAGSAMPEGAPPAWYALVEYEATISAPPDQTLVTVGELDATWADERDASRTYYRYRAPHQTNFQFAVALARYDVATAEGDGVTYQVYHHPAHATNVADLLTFAQQSVALFEENFGPYPFDYYRIAEIPDYVGAAAAYPGVVFAREGSVFQLDTRDTTKVNQVALLAAHETAHQWFAHMLQPAEIAGYTLLTETLAQYSEQLYLAHCETSTKMRKHLTAQRDFYMGSRSYLTDEPPLIHVDGRAQAPISYQKGSLAMFAISRALTTDTVNARLQGLVREFGLPSPDGGEKRPRRRATSLDLLEALSRRATPTRASVVGDWLTRVIVYDISIESAKTVELPDGQFETTVVIPAARFELNGEAKEVSAAGETAQAGVASEIEVGMDESVAIALLTDHPDRSSSLDAPLALEDRRLLTGRNTIVLVSAELPAYIALDPFGYLPDRDPFDNMFKMKSGGRE